MNKEIILITGGSRSGKSAYGLHLADLYPGRRYYIATCPAFDGEMKERIARHRRDRDGAGWITIEETLDLAGALGRAREGAFILLDCLTLWINNLLLEHDRLTEDDIVARCRTVLEACSSVAGTVVFVSNEVGMGIVPDNPLARQFRDLAGRCNQVMAASAHCVIFMVSGIPVKVK